MPDIEAAKNIVEPNSDNFADLAMTALQADSISSKLPSVSSENAVILVAQVDTSNLLTSKSSAISVDFKGESVAKKGTVEEKSPSLIEESIHAGTHSMYSAAKGMSQLVGIDSSLPDFQAPAPAEFGSARWHAQAIGSAVGIIAPFILARKGAKGLMKSIGHAADDAMFAGNVSRYRKLSVAEGALSGAILDTTMRPIHESEGNFWLAKTKHGITGAATFGTMTKAGMALNSYGLASKSLLGAVARNPVSRGGLTGVPAGLAQVSTHSLLEGKAPSIQNIKETVYTHAYIGSTLSAARLVSGRNESLTQRVSEGRATLSELVKVGGNSKAKTEAIQKQTETAAFAKGEVPMSVIHNIYRYPIMRCMINWSRLKAENVRATTHNIESVSDLSKLMHSWYADKSGKHVGFDAPGAKNLSVMEVYNNPKLSGKNQSEIVDVVNQLKKLQPPDGDGRVNSPVQIQALAYHLPGGKMMIIDGNHRIASLPHLTQQGVPFRLTLHAIKGPIDGFIFDGLAHYQANPAQAIKAIQDVGGPAVATGNAKRVIKEN